MLWIEGIHPERLLRRRSEAFENVKSEGSFVVVKLSGKPTAVVLLKVYRLTCYFHNND